MTKPSRKIASRVQAAVRAEKTAAAQVVTFYEKLGARAGSSWFRTLGGLRMKFHKAKGYVLVQSAGFKAEVVLEKALNPAMLPKRKKNPHKAKGKKNPMDLPAVYRPRLGTQSKPEMPGRRKHRLVHNPGDVTAALQSGLKGNTRKNHHLGFGQKVGNLSTGAQGKVVAGYRDDKYQIAMPSGNRRRVAGFRLTKRNPKPKWTVQSVFGGGRRWWLEDMMLWKNLGVYSLFDDGVWVSDHKSLEAAKKAGEARLPK